MPDLETALSILATEIKNAGYSVRITCNFTNNPLPPNQQIGDRISHSPPKN